MLASNSSANGFPDRMNGLDFFFSPPATTTDTGNSGEDDDWGDFVESSDATRVDSNGFFADRNGANSSEESKSGSAPSLNEAEKKSQAQWVASRGPVPLAVFGEEEEDGDGGGSSAPDSAFRFPLDSFSIKHNNGTGSVNKVVNTNTTVGISDLIANLYKGNGQDELKIEMKFPENNPGHPEMNGNYSHVISSRLDVNLSSSAGICVKSHLGMDDKESLSSHTIESSGVSLENLNWNPLKLETERSERPNNEVNSSSIGITLGPDYSNFGFVDKHDDVDEDDDGWEFKTAESMFQSGNGVSKEEQDNTKSGSAVVQNTINLSSGGWGPSTNGTGPNLDTGKIDAVTSVFDRGNGDDDSWANGWEFKAAEAPKNHLTNKESNGWGVGSGFEPTSAIEITTPHQSNSKKELQWSENGSISFPNNANVNSEETSWGFEQLPLKNGKGKEEKEVQTDKPKGALALSLFGDEEVETSDTMALEDNPISVRDFSLREKTKAPTPPVSINDLISSLYSRVEEKSAVNLPEQSDKYRFASVKAATDSNLVNGEDDSWEFQGPTKSVVDLGRAEGADDFDGTSWEFQGPPVALTNPDVVEGVNEFDDDSWEFQDSSQPVNGSNLTNRVGENDAEDLFSFSDEFRECHEKPVVQLNDYQNLFEKLKTELSIIALNHLEMLKKARNLDADSDELAEVQKCDGELEDLQNWLTNDVLIGEVNLERLHPKSSGITELIKDLQEPKFRAIDSEDSLSERLLLAEKDWKSAIELLKHAMLTLKTLNVCSPEQQSKYVSTWFAIASACAQELRHAASIWKQVIEKDVQEEILSKPRGKSFTLSVGEIYRVTKILKTSARLYKPWIILAPTYNIMAVLDECAKLWLISGLEEALQNHFDYSADQLLQSIKHIDEVDAFTQHTRTISTAASTCYISGLNTELVPGIKTVGWNGEHYLLPLANLWANLISRDPPSLPHQLFSTVS